MSQLDPGSPEAALLVQKLAEAEARGRTQGRLEVGIPLRQLLAEMGEWARQVGSQPPDRVTSGIAAAGRDLHRRAQEAIAASYVS